MDSKGESNQLNLAHETKTNKRQYTITRCVKNSNILGYRR